jgi:hypothetical protein
LSQRKKRRISQIQQEIDRLQREFNSLLGIRKRSLRAIGPTPAGARQQGEMRRRGRIFGCLPGGGAPCECECACGQVNSSLGVENINTVPLTMCWKNYAGNAVIRTCTLNLPNPACVVIMAAVVMGTNQTRVDIQRPLGTSVVDQRATAGMMCKIITCGDTAPFLNELEACESLPAGNYTWSLTAMIWGALVYGSWIKAREITCA